ncbi:Transcriptional regulator, RpiR family [uncultured spirochete]|uniref:Transcriptional regulator, RpiR family n=1 Tax=uncultured spirochete TaxID=156406 RepID=A0A3P3XP32_9SPIR|nr:Transcriptional regulator, RpiR family [uncultured spirochete]
MSQGALDTIVAAMPTLAEKERKIAAFIQASPQKALHLNISELARQAGTSPAAVVRFCKHIGAGKYTDFKIWLAKDVYQGWGEKYLPDLELESQTPGARALHDMTEAVRRTMSALSQTLDPRAVEEAAERIRAAGMIAIFGVGASGLVASDLHQKLTRIGIPSSYLFDTHAQIAAACSLHPHDIAFIVSYSGETDEMIEVAAQAKARGSFLIAMTMTGPNRLRESSDLILEIPSVERIYRSAAELSRISQLAAIDILFNVLISHDLDSAIAALERSMQATHRF